MTSRRRAIGVLGALLVAALAVVAPASLPGAHAAGALDVVAVLDGGGGGSRGGRRGRPAPGGAAAGGRRHRQPSTAQRCRPRSHRCSVPTLPWVS